MPNYHHSLGTKVITVCLIIALLAMSIPRPKRAYSQSTVASVNAPIQSSISDVGQWNTYASQNPLLDYMGGMWQTQRVSGAMGGTLNASTLPGASLTLHFEGTGVRVIYTEGPDSGLFSVRVDDETLHTVNGFAGHIRYGQIYALDDLPTGEHTLHITNLTGMLSIEAVQVQGQLLDSVSGSPLSPPITSPSVNPTITTFPFTDDFENSTSNWTMDSEWTHIDSDQHSGSWSMYGHPTPEVFGNYYLTLTEPLDLSSLPNPILSLWMHRNLGLGREFHIQISTDGGANWTSIVTYTTSLTNWTQRQFDLSAYASQPIQLRFRMRYYSGPYPGAWWIDDVWVGQDPAIANQPPVVDAGPDATMLLTTGGTLNATVTDDGLPLGNSVDLLWSKTSGPGTVTFLNDNDEDTTVSFSAAGVYVLHLSASDGELSASDEVTITVKAPLTLPFSDSFESDTSQWTLAGAWQRLDTQSAGGYWAMRSYPAAGAYLGHNLTLNNPLDLTESTTPILTFWTKHTLVSGQLARVRVSTNGGTTWTAVDEHSSTVTNWVQRTIDLSAFAGQMVNLDFRLVYPQNSGSNRPLWWVDNVWVGEAPSPSAFFAELEWEWTGSGGSETQLGSSQVIMTPAVVDLDKDGIPDLVFTTFADLDYRQLGILRAIRGDDSGELFAVTNTDYRVNSYANIAVGDIDGDTYPEIVALHKSRQKLIAFEHDGTFKWLSVQLVTGGNSYDNDGGPALADLDGDGQPEIIWGYNVLNADGTVRWTGTESMGANKRGPLSIAANLDMVGDPEVVAGNTAYRADGTVYWHKSNLSDGYNAIGDFDDDDYPEVVLVSDGNIYLLEHDGTLKWGPKPIPGGGWGGAPVVADLDGDGQPEIGVAGANQYAVFDTDGALLWNHTIADYSSGLTSASVFDFEGDGLPEIVYGDEKYLYIFRGSDGAVMWQVISQSRSAAELPVVADIDADGEAEIVKVSNIYGDANGKYGVQVYGSLDGDWVAARSIWNQHSYHITNVNDDGTIPATEFNNWESFNSYRRSDINDPPTVNAGVDASTTLLAGIALDGTVSDDGRLYLTPTLLWTADDPSNPGITTFVNATDEDPTVSFSAAGTYVLRLTADDGEYTVSDEVTITVIDNVAPAVDAGPDALTTLLAGITLDGTVSDDGWLYPIPSLTWTQISGPVGGTATFSNPAIEDPTVSFDVAGDYVLQLTADDGELSPSDEVTITVVDNQIPTVDAGPDASTTLLAGITLDGTVSDDGWLNPTPVLAWTQISGPVGGIATFSNPAIEDPTVSFDVAGDYVLQLTADDGELSAYDEVTITVVDNQPPVVEAIASPPVVNVLAGTILDGTVSDDGWLNPTPSLTWTQTSGPGTASFFDPAVEDTVVTFDTSGTYVLRLTADDGEFEGYDEVTVTVWDVTLTLEPATARPQITGANYTLTATLTDETGQPLPGYTIDFIFDVNSPNLPANTPQVVTDAAGTAPYTYTGTNNGTDTIVAQIMINTTTVHSNSALVNWITPVEDVSTSTVWGCFFHAPDGTGGAVSITVNNEPVFCQAFPSVNFNPASSLGYSANPSTTPFTNVTVDLTGQETGTIVAQGNGYQAGTGSLTAFESVFTGELVVGNNCGDPCVITFSIYSDDGFIFGIGDGAERIGGAWYNAPATTIFQNYPTMGAYNTTTGPTERQVTVSFPSPGTYPYEIDYSQGPCCHRALTLGIGSEGLPAAGFLLINSTTSATLATGETASFEVTAIDASGSPLAGLSVLLTVKGANADEWIGITDATGQVVFEYKGFNPGQDVVQASAWIQGDIATYSAEEKVNWTGTPVSDPNVLAVPGCIGAPANQAVLAGQYLIKMATNLPDPGYWTTLEYWPVNHPELVTALTPSPVWVVQGAIMGVDAVLDTTLLANGSYVIHAVCADDAQNPTAILDSGIMVTVTGENKLGRVKFSVTDLVVPVTGLPIAIGRTYDSLERNYVGDFGYGWSLDVASPRVEVDAANNVTLTLPDGKRTTFYFTPQPNPLLGFLMTKKYTTEPGVYGSLDSNGCDLLTVSGGSYFCFPGSYYSTTRFTYTDPYGRKFVINDQDPSPEGYKWRLTSITDLNNNRLTFTPDGITSSANNLRVDFVRDGERITSITDPMGNVYGYGYDTNGDLVSVTLPDTPAIQYDYYTTPELAHFFHSGTDPRGNTIATTTYDADGRLETVIDALGYTTTYDYDLTTAISGQTLMTITNPDGGTSELTNDENVGGKLVKKRVKIDDSPLPVYRTTTFDYDASLNLTAETVDVGGLDLTTTYAYDDKGNRTSVIDPAGQTVFEAEYNQYGGPEWIEYGNGTNRLTVTSYDSKTYMPLSASDNLPGNNSLGSFQWDSHGNPKVGTDANGNTIGFGYDDYGNLLSETDQELRKTEYTYDLLGRTQSVKDPRQNVTEYDYDALGRLTMITLPASLGTIQYRYDNNGNRTEVIDARGYSTEYEYDAANNLERVIFADGTWIEMTYNFRGRIETQTDQLGRTTVYGYDKAGRLTTITAAQGTVDQAITQYVYDNAGRRTKETDPEGNATEYHYDKANCLTHVIRLLDPNDPNDDEDTEYQCDAAGRRTLMIDPNGKQTQYTYDVRDRLTKITYHDGTYQEFQYDGMGNLLFHWDQARKMTEFQYDKTGQLRFVYDPLRNKTEYRYDAAGNLETIIDANNHETTFQYDELNRQTRKTWPDLSFEIFGYDGNGNLTSHQLADLNTNSFVYNNMNRLTTATYLVGEPGEATVTYTYTDTGQRETVIDGRGTTTYTYDNLDRVTSIVPPGSLGSVSYTYYVNGNRKTMTTPAGTIQYQYDRANRLEKVTDPNNDQTQYKYDDAGRLTDMVYPNNITVTYGYDDLNRLEDIQHMHTDTSTVFESYHYDLGDAGNRLSVTELDGSKIEWLYDDAYRLTDEKRYDTQQTLIEHDFFDYDPVGNRTTATTKKGLPGEITINTIYNVLDQVMTSGSASYDYDDRGNLVQITDGADTTTFTWDGQDRMTSASMPGGQNASYAYDADGRRVSQTVGATTTTYLWDESSAYGDVVYETDGTQTISYVLGGGRLISQDVNGTLSYYLYDAQGSTRALASDTGTITDTYDYRAFGDLYPVQPASLATPYLYTGQRFDSITGQYYLRARYYNPGAGHFLSRDIWPADFNNPITLNRYAYVSDNPINLFDPTGYMAAEDGGLRSLATTVITVTKQLWGYGIFRGATSGLIGYSSGVIIGSAVTALVRGENYFDVLGQKFRLIDLAINMFWGAVGSVLMQGGENWIRKIPADQIAQSALYQLLYSGINAMIFKWTSASSLLTSLIEEEVLLEQMESLTHLMAGTFLIFIGSWTYFSRNREAMHTQLVSGVPNNTLINAEVVAISALNGFVNSLSGILDDAVEFQ